MADDSPGLFVGVGVGTYAVRRPLPRAVEDVREVARLLGFPELAPLLDPTEAEVVDYLRSAVDRLPEGGLLVVYWSGHGELAAGLRLLTRDDDRRGYDGMGFAEVVRPLVRSGASQMLFVVDVCHSGAAIEAAGVAQQLLALYPPQQRPWVGFLTACLDVETARDGAFAAVLTRVLASGPRDPLMRETSWSQRSRYISLDTLANTVALEWSDPGQTLDLATRGVHLPLLRNPLYAGDIDLAARVVEHLLLAARGGAGLDEVSAFTGRTTEVDEVVAWVRAGRAGLHVVTGPPGTGKSAIVGRVVSWSVPAERRRLLAQAGPPEHADPGEGAVHAHVHARGLAPARLAGLIDEQLVRAGILPRAEQERDPLALVTALAAATEAGGPPPVVVVDGLDEAGSAAFDLAREVVLPLARHLCLVVATRQAHDPLGHRLLDLLTPAEVLDLGTDEAEARGRAAMHDYVLRRLAGGPPTQDPEAVAQALTERTGAHDANPFLVARLVTGRLRTTPLDTSVPGWADGMAATLEQALEADLADVPAPGPGVDGPQLARRLLTALTWGLGAGLPLTEWAAVASTLAPAGTVSEAELAWILGRLGRYVVQDAESGEAVYRLAHASFAGCLRPAYAATEDAPLDPAAEPVATALVERYRSLLAGGVPAERPAHLWRYLPWYAASAGQGPVAALGDLADVEPAARTLHAQALGALAGIYVAWGRPGEALPAAEAAVQAWERVAQSGDAAQGRLAGALSDLGVCRHQAGDPAAALEAAGRAIDLLRPLADADAAARTLLGVALTNLAVSLSDLGRDDDAGAVSARAVTVLRTCDVDHPLTSASLARALSNHSIRLVAEQRHVEATAAAREAVDRYGGLADRYPGLGGERVRALANLSTCLVHEQAAPAAVATAQDAVRFGRGLARSNPTNRSVFALALHNLARLRVDPAAGEPRPQDALELAGEALALRRELAEGRPSRDIALTESVLAMAHRACGRTDVALDCIDRAIAELASMPEGEGQLEVAMFWGQRAEDLAVLGREQESLDSGAQECRILRAVAERFPAHRRLFAVNLNGQAVRLWRAERHGDALLLSREATEIYRELFRQDPSVRDDLALSESVLALRHEVVGEASEAIDRSAAAVVLRRSAYAEDPSRRGELSAALAAWANRLLAAHRAAEALAPLAEAAALWGETPDGTAAQRADAAFVWLNLGTARFQADGPEASLHAAQTAYRIYRGVEPLEEITAGAAAGAASTVGVVLELLGRAEEAVEPLADAVRWWRAVPVDVPGATLALTAAAASLAGALHARGDARFAQARREALDLLDALPAGALPAEHVDQARQSLIALDPPIPTG